MLINFFETFTNLLSPDKQTHNTTTFLSPIATQLQVNNNGLENVYKSGQTYADWSVTTTYQIYALVKYGKSVYYSAINDNTGNNPFGSEDWVLVTPNFIGTDQRIFFDGTKLIFEYAINTYFGTQYNPDTTKNNEIYVETLSPQIKQFMIGYTDTGSDKIYKSSSTGNIKKNNPTGIFYNLTVWVKGLDTPGKPSTGEIKSFSDRYINAGIVYNIQGY